MTWRPRPVLVASLLAALTAACSTTDAGGGGRGGAAGRTGAPPPAWVDDDYAALDAARFLAGVGSAPGIGRKAVDDARLAGMRRINESIVASVDAELTTASRALASSARGEEWEQSMQQRVQIASQGDLPGAKDTDRWVDPGTNTTWVRVTVERELLVARLLTPVEESLTLAQGLVDGRAAAGDDPARELVTTLKAYDQVARTFPEALRAAAAARSGGGRTALPASARAVAAWQRSEQFLSARSEELSRLAPRLSIEALAGDAQRGLPRGRLAEPLVGRVTLRGEAGEQPFAGVPVRFRAELEGRAPSLVPSGAATDAAGRISCEVRDLAVGRGGQGSVLLEIDVESLGPSRLAELLPAARFVYSVATPGQTAVAVGITASFEGQPLPGEDLTTAVAGHLSEKGFRAAPRPDIARLSVPELTARLAGEFQYAIRGEVKTRRGTRSGDSQFFLGEASLEIVDLSSGAVMATLSSKEKGISSDRTATGARSALVRLQPVLLVDLDKEFVSAFGS